MSATNKRKVSRRTSETRLIKAITNLIHLVLFILISNTTLLNGPLTAQNQTTVDFNRDVKPILSNHCFACHGPDENSREAGLRLDQKESALSELESGEGTAIVPGDIEKSLLIKRIEANEDWALMPPKHFGKPLNQRQKLILSAWVRQGAPFQKHWSYRKLVRPAVPVPESGAEANPIDAFLIAALEEAKAGQASDQTLAANYKLADRADHETLARRLHVDLTGLPAGFVTEIPDDISNDEIAYQQLVDALLSNPAFGERMAIYWLDLVRYADTVGYHGDQEHRITPYRDWVINAFNDNMPFDQFTIEQLAGDLLPNPSTDQLIATGYNRLLQTTHEGGAQDKEYLAKYFSDRVRNVADVWFGATVACAECHDHKYDPIPQTDFYRLGAFFADIKEQGAYKSPNSTPTTRPPEINVLSPLLKIQLKELVLQRNAIYSSIEHSRETFRNIAVEKTQLQQVKDINKKIADLRAQTQWTMITVKTIPRTVRVLNRGDWMDKSGQVVQPGIPSALSDLNSGKRLSRLDLANWIVGQSNPLTARVMANRLWFICFGEGLYRSMEDSGAQGDPPTHPELLDWLAVELVESGWNIKHTLKLILLSKAYRQSSVNEISQIVDPENLLYMRQNRFRLPAEMIRDEALAVSGLLNRSMGGPSAKPYQPPGYYAHLNFPTRRYKSDRDANQYRRGIYVHWQRQFLHPMLKAFDAPSREECTAKRSESNTPLAALALLNDPTFVEAAREFAELAITRNDSVEARINWMWSRVVYRKPSQAEVDLLNNLVQSQLSYYQAHPQKANRLNEIGNSPPVKKQQQSELAAWTFVARALLNLNETIVRN